LTIETEFEKEQLAIIKLEKIRIQNEISQQEELKTEIVKNKKEEVTEIRLRYYKLELYEPEFVISKVLKLIEKLHKKQKEVVMDD